MSVPHAASWLLVIPSPGLDLHLDPNELQISIQWWLGIDTARGSSCSLCPGLALDRLGNHATTCKRGGDVVTRHNRLHNVTVEFCHCAHHGVRVESGSSITSDLSRTRPADVLVLNSSHLAIITSSHKGKVLTELYSRLNFTLVRAVARALLARCAPSLGLQDII